MSDDDMTTDRNEVHDIYEDVYQTFMSFFTKDVTKQYYIYGLNVEVTLPRSEMPKDYQLVLSHIVIYGRNY